MYPSLCFTDGVTAYVSEDSKALLEALLEADTYATLFAKENVQFRFKIIEILGNLFVNKVE